MYNPLDLFLAEIDLLKSQLELQSYGYDDAFRQSRDVLYTYHSNRIEGCTLTPSETEMVIKTGLMIGEKPMRENLAALNHYQAIDFIRTHAADQTRLSEALLKHIHSILSRAVDRKYAGAYRDRPAVIQGSRHIPPTPEHLPESVAEAVQWLRLEGPFMHPVLFAAETHQRLLALQPFNSSNGPCARLAMNLILLAEGYPFAIIHGDADSCRDYFAAFDQALDGDKSAWFRLIAERVMNEIQELLKLLEQVQGTLE
jgi:Fic family protein